MQSAIHSLFEGEVCPLEQVAPDTEEYKENLHYYTINDELVKKQLADISEKMLERYEELKFYQNNMERIEVEDMFSYGFRLGLRLAAEAFLG